MDKQKVLQKKYLIMPDSFKGTMDSIEVCEIMKSAVLEKNPGAEVVTVPVADGGEGTVDCFLSAFGGKKKTVTVTGPYGKKVQAAYGITGDTAIIEMAAASGFALTDNGMRDPSAATTFGVGELVRDAVESGCRRIILGLGGSCSNDGGAGMAAALGTVFYDEAGKSFVPAGRNLDRISRIDKTASDRLLGNVAIEAMCDIDNPLYGPRGAAYVFAPQKGADEAMVRVLDGNLKKYAETVKAETGADISELAGGGAAGGTGAGAYVFLGARLRQGIDVILDMLGFEKLIKDCRVIFTGEGSFDSQSLGGKVAVGISRRAMKSGIPVIVVAGSVADNISGLSEVGITDVFQTDPGTYESQSEMFANCRKDLKRTMLEILGKTEF
ncbi:MAG: glycerate kinase [Clostridiales bacterium]|nr:glycerate kinase [Clostridiales bacterium]